MPRSNAEQEGYTTDGAGGSACEKQSHQRFTAHFHIPRLAVWERVVLSAVVLLVGYFLYQAGGGFPPYAWTLLALYLAGREQAPLFGQVLWQAFAFLVAWLLILYVSLQLMRPTRLQYGTQQHVSDTSAPSTGITPASISASQQETAYVPVLPSHAHSQQGQRHQEKETHMLNHDVHFPSSFTKEPPGDTYISGRQEASSVAAFQRGTAGSLSLFTASSRDNASPTSFQQGKGLFERMVYTETPRSTRLTIQGALLCQSSCVDTPAEHMRDDAALISLGICRVSDDPSSFVPYSLFVLADGVSYDHTQRTTSSICTYIAGRSMTTALSKNAMMDEEAIQMMLQKSFQYTNRLLLVRHQQHALPQTTTMTIALLLGNMLSIASVGENRACLYRPYEGFVQNSASYTFRQGVNVLGYQESFAVERTTFEVQPEDILLLCSDGFWKSMHSMTLQRLMARTLTRPRMTPEQCCLALQQAASTSGSHEHISTIVTYMGGKQ